MLTHLAAVVPPEFLLDAFDEAANAYVVTPRTAAVISRLLSALPNVRNHCRLSRDIFRAILKDQLEVPVYPASPEAALSIFFYAATTAEGGANTILRELETMVSATSGTLVRVLSSSNFIVSSWPQLLKLFIKFSDIDSSRGTEIMAKHFSNQKFCSALTNVLAVGTERGKLDTILLSGKIQQSLPEVWTPLFSQQNTLDFIFGAMNRLNVPDDAMDRERLIDHLTLSMKTVIIFAQETQYRLPFTFAFNQLFQTVSSVLQYECETLTQTSLELLQVVLSIKNVATTAQLCDVVLPFFDSLPELMWTLQPSPSDIISHLFQWFSIPEDSTVCMKIKASVDAAIQHATSVDEHSPLREYHFRSCCKLLGTYIARLHAHFEKDDTGCLLEYVMTHLQTLLHSFTGDFLTGDHFLSTTYSEFLELIQITMKQIKNAELKRDFAEHLCFECKFVRRLLELRLIYNDSMVLALINNHLLQILELTDACNEDETIKHRDVVEMLPIVPEGIIDILLQADDQQGSSSPAHERLQVLCLTLLYSLTKVNDKVADEVSTYHAICAFITTRWRRYGNFLESDANGCCLPAVVLVHAAALLSRLGKHCCADIEAENYLLAEIRREMQACNASLYCNDPHILSWLWEKLDHSVSTEIMAGALDAVMATTHMPEQTDEIFTSPRGIRVLANLVGEEHSEKLRQGAIRVLFDIVQRKKVPSSACDMHLLPELWRLFSLKGLTTCSISLVASLELAIAIVSTTESEDSEPQRRVFTAVINLVKRDPRLTGATIHHGLLLTSLNFLSLYLFQKQRNRDALAAVEVTWNDTVFAKAAHAWSELRSEGTCGINVAAAQLRLLVHHLFRSNRQHGTFDSENSVSNDTLSSNHNIWSCTVENMIHTLRTGTSELQKTLECRNFTLKKGSRATVDDGHVSSELQMLLIDHIAAPDANPVIKNAALSAIAKHVTDAGCALSWHRFLLPLIMQGNPDPSSNTRVPDTLTPYLTAIKERECLSEVVDSKAMRSAVCSELLLEVSERSKNCQDNTQQLHLLNHMCDEDLLTSREKDAVKKLISKASRFDRKHGLNRSHQISNPYSLEVDSLTHDAKLRLDSTESDQVVDKNKDEDEDSDLFDEYEGALVLPFLLRAR